MSSGRRCAIRPQKTEAGGLVVAKFENEDKDVGSEDAESDAVTDLLTRRSIWFRYITDGFDKQ